MLCYSKYEIYKKIHHCRKSELIKGIYDLIQYVEQDNRENEVLKVKFIIKLIRDSRE